MPPRIERTRLLFLFWTFRFFSLIAYSPLPRISHFQSRRGSFSWRRRHLTGSVNSDNPLTFATNWTGTQAGCLHSQESSNYGEKIFHNKTIGERLPNSDETHSCAILKKNSSGRLLLIFGLQLFGLLIGLFFFQGIHSITYAASDLKQAALEHYENARKLRAGLEAKPARNRQSTEYLKVINEFRAVYRTTPASSKADDSIFSIGELYQSMARDLKDAIYYSSALKTFAMMRKEYPGSPLVAKATFTMAEIQLHNLKDFSAAQDTYSEVIKKYPRSPYSSQAKARLVEVQMAIKQPQKKDSKTTTEKPSPLMEKKVTESAKNVTPGLTAGSTQPSPTQLDEKKIQPVPVKGTGKQGLESTAIKPDIATPPVISETTFKIPEKKFPLQAAPPSEPALLQEIRFWSTSEYTRVVISLTSEVPFSMGLVESPDRIYLDFANAKLDSELTKGFEINKGHLRKIRCRIQSTGSARIVLEGDSIGKYRVATLTKPYRIVIDIQRSLESGLLQSDPQGRIGTTRKGKPQSDEKQEGGIMLAKQVLLSTPSNNSASEKNQKINKKSGTGGGVDNPISTEQSTSELPNIRAGQGSSHLADKEESIQKPSTIILRNEKPGTVNSSQSSTEKTANPAKSVGMNRQSPAKPAASPDTNSEESMAGAGHVASPMSDGSRSLIRTLGLKIEKIVIDPGHGGHDTGTIGPSGLKEKDLVLDVALKLKTLLEEKLGGEVILTREDDTFIPLETRTAIANQHQADLFISIHANSSRNKKVRGVETFFLNFATSSDVEEIAARENATSQKTIFELEDLIKKIALKEKMDESKEFAQAVQKAMMGNLLKTLPQERNRGVKQAPFIVLIGANMPSILTEVSFMSNPSDEKLLKTSNFRQKIAEALLAGINNYQQTLSGLKTAKNTLQTE
jgi:N-acetylmuramoyl-L-alanine amidase